MDLHYTPNSYLIGWHRLPIITPIKINNIFKYFRFICTKVGRLKKKFIFVQEL